MLTTVRFILLLAVYLSVAPVLVPAMIVFIAALVLNIDISDSNPLVNCIDKAVRGVHYCTQQIGLLPVEETHASDPAGIRYVGMVGGVLMVVCGTAMVAIVTEGLVLYAGSYI